MKTAAVDAVTRAFSSARSGRVCAATSAWTWSWRAAANLGAERLLRSTVYKTGCRRVRGQLREYIGVPRAVRGGRALFCGRLTRSAVSCWTTSISTTSEPHINVNGKHPSSVACLPVYKKDGKRAVYCAQGWNAFFVPDAAVEAYDAILLGYPHVMPALRGAPLAQFASRCVAAGTCLCLDVNEAANDYTMPLGDASDAYENMCYYTATWTRPRSCVGGNESS